MQGIVGQDRALEVIRSALEGGRMHHAWIFHGPEGVGKATTAHALAKLLLCHNRGEGEEGAWPEACGECESCRLIEREGAAHPDLHVLHKELAADSELKGLRDKKQMNIPVDLLRERMVGGWVGSSDNRKYIEPLVGQRSVMKRGRVFIIDEAELLAREGQNILLKTLEEPPAGTCIVLVTAHEQRLLPTVRSRCQRVAFGPLEDEAVQRWLGEREEAAELGEAERARIVRFARGSLGRAEMGLAYRLDEWNAAVEPLVKRVAAGQADHRLGAVMAERVEDLAKRWVAEHKGASKDAANKAAVRQMLGLMGEFCRAGLREASEGGDEEAGDPAALERRAEPWLVGVELLQEAERHLETNVAPPLLLDELAVEWAHRVGSRRAAR